MPGIKNFTNILQSITEIAKIIIRWFIIYVIIKRGQKMNIRPIIFGTIMAVSVIAGGSCTNKNKNESPNVKYGFDEIHLPN